jgi:hypothetical protein
MWEMRADDGGERQAPLNPADPFMVRGALGARGASAHRVEVSPEQRLALRRLRDAGSRALRRDLSADMLASLLRGRMVSLYGDRVVLTPLGALALATPLPGPVRKQRSR